MTTVRWSPYDLPVTLLSSAEIGSLPNNGLSVPGADTVNSSGPMYCDFEFVAGAAFSPGTNAILDIWMLRSLDGISFEDGSSSVAPPRDPDVSILVRSGTSITPRAGQPRIKLPPGHYKGMARNRLGATIPAGSVVRVAAYTQQAV